MRPLRCFSCGSVHSERSFERIAEKLKQAKRQQQAENDDDDDDDTAAEILDEISPENVAENAAENNNNCKKSLADLLSGYKLCCRTVLITSLNKLPMRLQYSDFFSKILRDL